MQLPFQNRRSLNATTRAAASGQPVCQTPSKEVLLFLLLCPVQCLRVACTGDITGICRITGFSLLMIRRIRDRSGRVPVRGFPARARQNASYLPDPLHHNIGPNNQFYDVKFSFFHVKTGGGCRGSDTYFQSPVARIVRNGLDNYDGNSSYIPVLWHGIGTCPTPSRFRVRRGICKYTIHTYNGPVNPLVPVTTEQLLLFVPAIR